MWLLSTSRAELKYFISAEAVPKPGFAILSHTWEKEEQSFEDVQKICERCKSSNENPRDLVCEKIRKFCELAEKTGYDWGWVDTCCIDKRSSAELSEAINSMFRYYALSGICFVYLSDVPDPRPSDKLTRQFFQSRWHKRGWTLQELIAPLLVVLLSSSWSPLGSKADLAGELMQATQIPASLLTLKKELKDFSVAQRMSWASRRATTRLEDEAYCLLGIFGVNMPTLYGEGRDAFRRLQTEILRTHPDTTIFAWGRSCSLLAGQKLSEMVEPTPLFATSPSAFQFSGSIAHTSFSHYVAPPPRRNEIDRPSFTLTPYGALAHVPLAVAHGLTLVHLAWYQGRETAPIFLVVARTEDGGLWSVVGKGGTRLVVGSAEDTRLPWTMTDIYLANRRDQLPQESTSTTPKHKNSMLMYPCNRSIRSPFHFNFRIAFHYTVSTATNVGLTWDGRQAAVLRLESTKEHDYQRARWSPVTMCFGVCTVARAVERDAPEENDERTGVIHWARATTRPEATEGDHHVCSEDHIADWPNHKKAVLYDVRYFNPKTGTDTRWRVEMGFGRSALNANTMILKQLEFHRMPS